MKTQGDIECDLWSNPSDERYEFFMHEKGKSDVWVNFCLIKFEGVVQEFVRCIKCSAILKYIPNNGTASLSRHNCPNQEAKTTSLEKYLKRSISPKKEELVKMQLRFIVGGLHPLSMTEGEGFLGLVQALITDSPDFSGQNVHDILASRKVLKRIIIPEECNRIKYKLQNIIGNNEISFTADIWTHEYREQTFLTLSAHLINESIELKKYVLGTRALEYEKPPDNILELTLDILREYEGKPEKKLSKGVIVTDNDSNAVLAFTNYTRISCACHNLNLVMQDILESNNTLMELKSVINEAKELITYFRFSELNDMLSTPLEQQVATNWKSVYIMLKSIKDLYAEIQDILISKDETNHLKGLDFTVLSSLTDFLNLFGECSKNLSSDTHPTLHRYVLWEQKLIKHCQLQPDDSELLKQLKSQTLIALQKQFKPHDMHYIALFLDPNFKSLKFLSEDMRMNVKMSVRSMLQSMLTREELRNVQKQIPTKRPKLTKASSSTSNSMPSASIFEEFQDFSGEEESHDVDCEIQSYLRRKGDFNDCPLEFWRNCNDLPLLQKLARQILNIPASSTTSEKLFSEAAQILQESRSQLLSSNLGDLIFLHLNCDLFD